MLEMTRQWAFDRYTFGRPLASYQEIKHRFADMTLWLEASKATVVAAARAVSTHAPEAPELVSAAASYVHDHGPELGQDCVQLHGGIGVTWEHDLHLYLRRVTLNALTFGTVRDHRERLAALVLDGATGEC
jgi:alkylation response protein AidB-like acyl-CoA dehydrogenase